MEWLSAQAIELSLFSSGSFPPLRHCPFSGPRKVLGVRAYTAFSSHFPFHHAFSRLSLSYLIGNLQDVRCDKQGFKTAKGNINKEICFSDSCMNSSGKRNRERILMDLKKPVQMRETRRRWWSFWYSVRILSFMIKTSVTYTLCWVVCILRSLGSWIS